MSDVLKISKDKRHRSSSSLAGTAIEGTRSERKLDLNGASIPEVDDHFAVAEARCEDLQEKIDMIKSLKRKRKLKKRSMTKVTDQQPTVPENIPFISVRTQPKKKVSQQAARLHRLQMAPNPARGYLDPATVEQHRMIGQIRNQTPQQENQNRPAVQDNKPYSRTRTRRSHAEGDNMSSQGVQITTDVPHQGVAVDSNQEYLDNNPVEYSAMTTKKQAAHIDSRYQTRVPTRRRHVPRDVPVRQQTVAPKWADDSADEAEAWRGGTDTRVASPGQRRVATRSQGNNVVITNPPEERPVVELFSKNRSAINSPENRRSQPASAPIDKRNREKKVREVQRYEDEQMGPIEDLASQDIRKEVPKHPRRVKYRSRRYELPTVASQMKQAGMRYYYGNANSTNIPFVVSKSTAPSHNIGVNIQQVLNGIKIQQPLSGIPLTIAHHMGLGHVPHFGTKSATLQPSLDNREINVIKVGQRQLHLPSYKYMSYSRLLSLYREGDGMVPRFLRAISRPHYFFTSMYNLASNRDDYDGATSKGQGGSQEAKQSLAEYANLYREYEHIDKCLKEGACEPELERRKEDLKRQLEAREQYIRKVVQEYRASGEAEQVPLRASASTAEDGYRHSTYKLNVGDSQQ